MIMQTTPSLPRTTATRLPPARLLLLFLVCGCAALSAGEAPAPPDLTAGGKPGGSSDWNLGATGLRGWIHSAAGHTDAARQILVTAVATGSPADGKLAVGDVILGVDGKPFVSDARIALAQAITEAEAVSGQLDLLCWRDGTTQGRRLALTVLGRYSDTAPYACEKSRRLFAQGCAVIAKQGLGGVDIDSCLGALALLASSREEYRVPLKEFARKAADYRANGMRSWYYGYVMMFLAEYALATGDRSVLPGLERLALETARGASRVGTWGHDFATETGNAPGYGCMNMPGLFLQIGLAMAREAGVAHPDIDRCLARSSGFLRWYVGKGAIPYGDHAPWPGHEDNGKNATAAVLFDLLGDREAAGYFAKMTTAAYSEREGGHTGIFFNILWAMPGVSRCGPLASGAYWKEHGWYYDLARRWDGSSAYQAAPQGEEEHDKYTRWDATGAATLICALPLKTLLLTGRKPSVVTPLTADEVTEVIAAGRDFHTARKGKGYRDRTVPQLLAGLTSWSPIVRLRSAQGLGVVGRGDPTVITTLVSSLAGTRDRDTRYGVCLALQELGQAAAPAAPALVKLLEHDDPWLVISAAEALARMGPAGKAATPELLRRMAAPALADDPRAMIQRSLSHILFERPGLLRRSLEGIDRRALIDAIRAGLRNEDGHARSAVSQIYKHLTDDDIRVLLPAIHQAVMECPPSGEMFSEGVHLAGLEVLTARHIDAGIDGCLFYARNQNQWGSQERMGKILHLLDAYGTHAKRAVPELRKIAEWSRTEAGFPEWARKKKHEAVVAAIARIEAATETPKLIALADLTPGASK